MTQETKKNVPATARAASPIQPMEPMRPRRARDGWALRLTDGLAFMRAFVERPLEVASVIPSSVAMEERVVRAADVAQARCVVELGPGTGGTTRALLRALSPQARLLAVDLNPGFCQRLRQRIADPRLLVQEGSAEDLAEHLSRWGLPAPDVIVSGMPFSTLPAETAQRIAAAICAQVAPTGRVVAYQVRAHVADVITPHLGTPEVSWEWGNVPPMRVFRWHKPGV